MELVTDDLPEIEDLLKELDLSHLAEKFYAAGFTESRYIMRMKSMDLRMMSMEWGVDREAIQKVHWLFLLFNANAYSWRLLFSNVSIAQVQDAIKNYKVEREVIKETVDPLMTLRNSLTYGKLVVTRYA